MSKTSCNCRAKSKCPLNGQCQFTDVVYKCTVLSPDKPSKMYLDDFIIIGSRLTIKVAQTVPPFHFKIYMGAKRNIRFKPNSSMVHSQKGTALF